MDNERVSSDRVKTLHDYSIEEVLQAKYLEYYIKNTPIISKYSSNEDAAKFKETEYLFVSATEFHNLITPNIVIRAFESLVSFYFREGKIKKTLYILVDYRNYLFSKYKEPEKINN